MGPRPGRSRPAASAASPRRRCATSSACCATPTAAPSASSTCTCATARSARWLQERLEAGYERTPARGAAADPAPAQRRRGVRDLPADQVRRAEALLARGRRVPHPAARRVLSRARPTPASTRSASAWPTAAASTCSRTSPARATRRSSREFEGNQDPRAVQGSGDVKYHLGTEGTFTAESGATTKVYLAANPSHLEAVDPVLEGIVRAKQDRIDLGGDGFSGAADPHPRRRGLRGPGRGHRDAQPRPAARVPHRRHRSTWSSTTRSASPPARRPRARRCTATDVAKGLQVPIFHVNGDDPEAVRARRRSSRSSSASSSTTTSSSTWSATAAAVTTRATTPR